MNGQLGSRAMNDLLSYVEEDTLPACYINSVQSFLWDFYPDLSWDTENYIMDLKTMLSHPELGKVQGWFMKKYHFNILAELNVALQEAVIQEAS